MLFEQQLRRLRVALSCWNSGSKRFMAAIRRGAQTATSTVLLLAIASSSFTWVPILRPTATASESTAADLGPAGTAHTDIGSSGAYQTAVPIEVPTYHGLEPRLGFVYNSNSGNSWLGVGWNLSGLSTIRRASPGQGAPNYDDNDVFYLDGMELIPCTETMQSPSCKYPASASPSYKAYTTKIESFQRIAFNSAWTGSGGWHVWTKTGTKMTYEAQVSTSAIGVFAWRLASVEDTLGNKVAYSYFHDGSAPNLGEQYIYEIIYNGTLVKFYYESRPIADVVTHAIGGDLVTTRYRLKAIDVQTGSSRVRAYALKYSVSSNSSRSLLESIQQFGKDATIDEDTTLCIGVASRCQFGGVTGGTAMPELTFTTPSTSSPSWAMGIENNYSQHGFVSEHWSAMARESKL